MKTVKVNEARSHLKKNGAKVVRITNGHEIWEKEKEIFSLPINHRIISCGVARKLLKFSGSKDF